MSELHFGFKPNNHKCSCGMHYGYGDYTPQQRAAMAARMRDKLPNLMSSSMIAFLDDWEKSHGKAFYSMGIIGTYSGEIGDYKMPDMKGKPLWGAIFSDRPIAQQRADIYG